MSQMKIWKISMFSKIVKKRCSHFKYKKERMRLDVPEVKAKRETCGKKTQNLRSNGLKMFV